MNVLPKFSQAELDHASSAKADDSLLDLRTPLGAAMRISTAPIAEDELLDLYVLHVRRLRDGGLPAICGSPGPSHA